MPLRYPLLIVSFVALSVLLYGHSVLVNDFVQWDDHSLIVTNVIVQSISLATIQQAFTSYDPELYVPLTMMSLQWDYFLGNGSPIPFHATNLVLHTLNALLVFFLLSRLARNDAWLVALCSALLFVVHPIQTEAVAWASARKDLLSTLFFLLSLCLYLQWQLQRRRTWYVCSLGAFLLGLLSKVSIVPLPLVLLLLDWREKRPLHLSTLLEKVPYFLLSIIFGIVAIVGQYGGSSLYLEKALIGSRAVFLYISKLMVPVKFSVFYPFTEKIALSNPELLFSVLGVFTLTGILWWKRHQCRDAFFAWLFFLLTVAPSFSNFTKGGGVELDVYIGSDRYAYIPSIAFLFLFVTYALSVLRTKRTYFFTIFSVVVLSLSVASFLQARVWQSTAALFLNVIDDYPNAHLAHNNVGTMLFEKGHIDVAMQEFRKALAIRPTARALFNLGQGFAAKDDYIRAMQAYEKAVSINPRHVDAQVNLGALKLRQGNAYGALHHFEQALRVEPDMPIISFNLGAAYEEIGLYEEAIGAYEKTVELDPGDHEAKQKVEELRGG